MQTRIGGLSVTNAAVIDRVAEDGIEFTPAERAAAIGAASLGSPCWLDDAIDLQPILQQPDVAKVEIGPEDRMDDPGVVFDDSEAASIRTITERRCAAHPHAPLLRCGKLVADALGGHLALELGEGQQHVEREAPHAGSRRSEEHTSELQSLMRISYAVF